MKNAVLDFMNSATEPEAEGANTLVLESAADRTAVFLAAMEEECTPEEFKELVLDQATALEAYGLIDDADAVRAAYGIVESGNASAMEAAYKNRKMKFVLSRGTQMTRAQKKAAMKLAKRNTDPNYEKYVTYRNKMIFYRQKVYDKWLSRGTREAKRLLKASAQTASTIRDSRGRQMEDKIKESIKKADKTIKN